MSIKQKKVKKPSSGLLPAIGMALAICIGLISWVIAPYLKDWTVKNTPSSFTGNEFDPAMMQFIFAAFIFMMLISLAGLLVAMFAPKKKSVVKETDLKQERLDVQREKEAIKRRRKKMSAAQNAQNRRKE